MQLFPMAAYIQLGPTFNSWESRTQQFFAGVPNGGREGNVLYYLDQKASHFKKYRIPAHENPYFSASQNEAELKRYGGKDSDEYLRLVLGKHGNPTYSIISYESIQREPFPFYSYRFAFTDIQAGKTYKDVCGLPELSSEHCVFAIDTGYADPTLIQVFTLNEYGFWRLEVRYRLTRIGFPEQAEIINWLAQRYKPVKIGIDAGAGGGGIGIIQDLQQRSRYYKEAVIGIRFNDAIVTGQNAQGVDLKVMAKQYGVQQLAKMLQEKELTLSELDGEGSSQLERVAAQRRADGTMHYFVQSERAAGMSNDDHIFASFIVFAVTLLHIDLLSHIKIKRLFGAGWF